MHFGSNELLRTVQTIIIVHPILSLSRCCRLVKVCLGETAICTKKLACGMPLVVLGVEITLSDQGATFEPSADKVRKWTLRIAKALKNDWLCAGDASKLAGALSWASQKIFRMLGRAMLRPIFKQGNSHNGKMNAELKLALRWWLQVLKLGIVEMRSWKENKQMPVHIFCDARSTPPRIAAVMIKDGRTSFCDMAPSDELMKSFKRRGDNQIMSLEILSIALGIVIRPAGQYRAVPCHICRCQHICS